MLTTSKDVKHSQLKLSYAEKIQSSPILCSKDSYNFFMKVWDKGLLSLQEQFCVIYLNNNNEVISWRCITSGSDTETSTFVKLTISIGLICMANKVIVAHNHPSGNLAPSKQDIFITNKLYKAFALIDILLLDHLIVSRTNYFSFIDNSIVIE